MKIRIINPVPDLASEITAGMEEYLSASLDPGTEIEFVHIRKGFSSIETEVQGIVNGAWVLEQVWRAQEADCDGIFINCFDDPALTAAREISAKPVAGPYESTVLVASMTGEKLGIITTDDYGMVCEERKARSHGFENRIHKVEKVDMTVLSLREGDLLDNLVICCKRLEQEGVKSAILGCTGMNFVADRLRERLRKEGCCIQVFEPLKTGIKALELLIKMGYNTSIKSTEIHMEDKLYD